MSVLQDGTGYRRKPSLFRPWNIWMFHILQSCACLACTWMQPALVWKAGVPSMQALRGRKFLPVPCLHSLQHSVAQGVPSYYPNYHDLIFNKQTAGLQRTGGEKPPLPPESEAHCSSPGRNLPTQNAPPKGQQPGSVLLAAVLFVFSWGLFLPPIPPSSQSRCVADGTAPSGWSCGRRQAPGPAAMSPPRCTTLFSPGCTVWGISRLILHLAMVCLIHCCDTLGFICSEIFLDRYHAFNSHPPSEQISLQARTSPVLL